MGKKNTANTYDIAKAAAVEALKLQKDEERQYVKKNRYHNTELLLRNYLSLMEHYENAKDKASDIMALDDLDIDEVIIKAIKRSRVRTMIMINQIDTCLEILRFRQASKGQSEKYEVIHFLYLDKARRDIQFGELVKVVAEELQYNERSIYRWKNEMVAELSILLFGVDGLKLDL